MMNREKIIRTTTTYTEIGYISDNGEFILHSFDDEPALIFGNKLWYKDGLAHRDNHNPVWIFNDGNYSFYKNGKKYWIINDTEYYNYEEIKETFKNKILELKKVNINILKENNIDAIWLIWSYYIILDQSQYNLAVLKFL